MHIEVQHLTKVFGTFAALRDVSLEVPDGNLVALLGPSGCGKTTLLRIIAGLDVPDQGTVLFEGENMTDRKVKERQVGFVFQHYALFRRMTIFENVAFGLRVRPRGQRPPETEIRDRVQQLLELVQLDWLADRHPAQLSGGQRQRVALARALAVEPKVLLLDEPFGALDAKVRADLRRWLRQLHDRLHLTAVLVTHDQEEALEVADRVVVMNEGQVEQIGTPEEVYDRPATPFVYQFLGRVNLFHLRAQDAKLFLGERAATSGESDVVVGYVRPHEIDLERADVRDTSSVIAVVSRLQAIGPIVRLELRRTDADEVIEAEMSKERYQELRLVVGEWVSVKPRNLQLFHPEVSVASGPLPVSDYRI